MGVHAQVPDAVWEQPEQKQCAVRPASKGPRGGHGVTLRARLRPDASAPVPARSAPAWDDLRARRSTTRRLLLRHGGAVVRGGGWGAVGARPSRASAAMVVRRPLVAPSSRAPRQAGRAEARPNRGDPERDRARLDAGGDRALAQDAREADADGAIGPAARGRRSSHRNHPTAWHASGDEEEEARSWSNDAVPSRRSRPTPFRSL